jgi:hypothetical protein
MKKIFILLFLIVVLVSFNVSAIDGYVALDYDTISQGGVGTIYLEKNINRWTIAGKFKTNLSEFALKGGWFPAGVPENQVYDLIIKYKLTDKITLRFKEGCKHYFSQSWIGSWKDEKYLNIGAKYEF